MTPLFICLRSSDLVLGARLCNENSNQTTHGTAQLFLLSSLGSVAWMFGMHAALHTNIALTFRSHALHVTQYGTQLLAC